MTARALALALGLAAAGAWPAHAGQTLNAAQKAAWHHAVLNHVPGTVDEPLTIVAALDWERLQRHVKQVESAEVGFLTRALVLHTDLAIAQREASLRRRGTFGVGSAVMIEDGRRAGDRARSPHFLIALQIADGLATRSLREARRVALVWFQAANGLFLHWGEASPFFLDRGLAGFPDDPSLLLYSGALHQMFADPRVQLFVRSEQPPDQPPMVQRTRPREFADEPPTDRDRAAIATAPRGGPLRATQELGRAEHDLRRALERDPTRVEARIRLAHVVGERGHPDEAVALAAEALRPRLPRFFEVYATLVLGRNQARLGRYADALASFDRAAAMTPAAQAPRMGRSQAMLASGRAADALAALTDGLGPARVVEAGDEEWAIHYRVHDPEAAARLAALRAEVK